MRFLSLLGRLPFALFLITTSAIFVAIGTWIESTSSSHQKAAAWIYSGWPFQLLLIGFFLNILLATLQRAPFHKRHIPFLITHLGLLMVIAGLMAKNIFGIQGELFLVEGTGSQWLSLPNTQTLRLENRQGNYFIPLQATLIAPHAKERYISWETGNIRGAPKDFIIGINLPTHTPKPFLSIEPHATHTRLCFHDRSGKIDTQEYPHDALSSWVAYQDGLAGYGQIFQGEWTITSQEEIDLRRQKALEEALSTATDPLIPPLALWKKNDPHFASAYALWLHHWHAHKSWLIEDPPINWSLLPFQELQALLFAHKLAAEVLRFPSELEGLEAIHWPFPIDENRPLLTAMRTIYTMQQALPPMGGGEAYPHTLFSLYCRLFDLTPETIVNQEIKVETEPFTLESPIERHIEILPPTDVWEEHRPWMQVAYGQETLDLLLDPLDTSLKWPTQDGKFLASITRKQVKLPFFIRLHRAVVDYYPGTQTPRAYHCSLSLNTEGPCPLSMNQVYETKEGYRLYLAGIGTLDDLGVHSVQLVINYDPVKWWLTYPGAWLVAIGSCWLLLRKRP